MNLANLRILEEAALATNWIKDRREGLKLQNLTLATKSNCRRPLRNQHMRVFGLRETIDPSRESIGNCKEFVLA